MPLVLWVAFAISPSVGLARGSRALESQLPRPSCWKPAEEASPAAGLCQKESPGPAGASRSWGNI